MSFYFIVPITQQTLAGQTVNAPKYFSTDLNGLSLSSLPYGLDGCCLVGLHALNAALSAETDVYSFPEDLTAELADADVAALANFLSPLNVPTDLITSGLTFADVLQIIALIFLANQAICGVTGVPTFSDGVTPSSAVSDSGASSLAPTLTLNAGKGDNTNTGNNNAPAPVTSNGPYDFTGIAASDTVGDTLNSLSQQFTDTVVL
jgi:hypothetical protein